jgi:transcriptional regulator with XRE-family HTH domain
MSTSSSDEYEAGDGSERIAPAMARHANPESIEAAADRLKITRIALGLSQAEICRQTGITVQAWNNAETGDNRLTIDNALKLCRRYGLNLEWLFRGDIRGIAVDLARAIAQAEREMNSHAKRA